MEKAKIDTYQLFSLIVLFELGTALVVPVGLDARQAAWIAILLGFLGGILLLAVYVYLFRQYPHLPLTGYAQKLLGKYAGWPIGFFYVVFFIYGGARDLRDVGSLLVSSVYNQTPLFVVNFLIIFAVAYMIHKGIEVTARTGEIMIACLFVFGLLSILLTLFSGIMDFKLLFPVLEEGWKPVLKTVFMQTWMFPFGESICFTMIFPYLNKPGSAFKTGAGAMFASALIISSTISAEITILGPALTSRSTFPLLSAISKINIGEFIQHVDAIAVFTLIVIDFFKVAIFYYAAAIGLADLFRVQRFQELLVPVGFLILFASMIIAGNFTEHIQEGRLASRSVYPIFAAAIPMLLMLAAWIRKRFSSAKPAGK